ncbi:hypothetical protein H4R34_002461 [Dimargaris verticillata]|uniref:Uncharacterized protein n=1 Tax=Dimargaris verticillata TaxID=2761393 RepID=A0A9W8EDJ3_9FUNG|nr:hypothetical protein H4R34_002461 [Dimargaris verticillata]
MSSNEYGMHNLFVQLAITIYKIAEQFFSIRSWFSSSSSTTTSPTGRPTSCQPLQPNCLTQGVGPLAQSSYGLGTSWGQGVGGANIVALRPILSPFFEQAVKRQLQADYNIPALFGLEWLNTHVYGPSPLITALEQGQLESVREAWQRMDTLLSRNLVTADERQALAAKPVINYGLDLTLHPREITVSFISEVWEQTKKIVLQRAVLMDKPEAVNLCLELYEMGPKMNGFKPLVPVYFGMLIQIYELNRANLMASASKLFPAGMNIRLKDPERAQLYECALVLGYKRAAAGLKGLQGGQNTGFFSRWFSSTNAAAPTQQGNRPDQRTCRALLQMPETAVLDENPTQAAPLASGLGSPNGGQGSMETRHEESAALGGGLVP